jgi:hypothetical protein
VGRLVSRQRVVVGTDERGRPKTAWAEPDRIDEPRYGHMQPAYDGSAIERRMATPEELAARLGPEPVRPDPITQIRPALNSPEHIAQSRRNGAEKTRAIHAARRSEKETPMPLLQEIPELPADFADLPPLERLAAQASVTASIHQAKVAADEAWLIARAALRNAYAAVALDIGDLPVFGQRFDEATEAVQNAARFMTDSIPPEPALAAEPATPAKPKRQPGHHPSKAQESQEKVERARRVMAAMERHGGDQRAAAAELGMRANAVAMVVKHAPRVLEQAAAS